MKTNIIVSGISVISAILFLVVFVIGALPNSINLFSGIFAGGEYYFVFTVYILVFASLIVNGYTFIKSRNKLNFKHFMYSTVSFVILVSITLFVLYSLQDGFAI